MINVFLIGTCRIHRPFEYADNDHYNTLNLLGKYTFLGYMYNIKEIKQFVDLLTLENDVELLSTIINPKFLDPIDIKKQFKETRHAFQLADLVVMEISTSLDKRLTAHDGEKSISEDVPAIEPFDSLSRAMEAARLVTKKILGDIQIKTRDQRPQGEVLENDEMQDRRKER